MRFTTAHYSVKNSVFFKDGIHTITLDIYRYKDYISIKALYNKHEYLFTANADAPFIDITII